MSRPIRVFCVDDDTRFLDALSQFLGVRDENLIDDGAAATATDEFTVETATTVEAAIEQFDPARTDCLVVTQDLPDGEGLDLLRSVRESHPSLPVVLVVADGSEAVAAAAVSADATDYVQKGTDEQQLARLRDGVVEAVETDRERRGRERRSELLRHTESVAQTGGWWLDFETDELVWTRGTRALFGVGDDYQPTASDALEFYHPEDQPAVQTALQETRETGERAAVEGRIQTADGRQRVVRATFVPVTEAGQVVGVRGAVLDVTESRAYEQTLRELHAVAADLPTYNSAAEICDRTVAAAETVLDFDHCVVLLDDGGGERLFVTAISEEFPADDLESLPVEGTLAGATYRDGETYVVDDADSHPVADPQGPYQSGLSVPIGDHGVCQMIAEQPAAFEADDRELAELLVSHTEQALDRLAREADLQRQNERLDEFVSVVSHDLRNPLNVVSGMLDLAEETGDPDYFQRCRVATDRMEELIDDLLTLARQGQEVTEPEPVSLPSVVQSAWETVDTESATLTLDADGEILADEGRLRQLVENLLRNAVDHGGPEVRITVGETTESPGFYVADDGPGVPLDRRDRVFEHGYSTADRGTGLGLSIVHEVAAAHGWTATVTDSETDGTRIEITGVERLD
jgi:signal transduction histidine kinase/FixJ family two-component response regulator